MNSGSSIFWTINEDVGKGDDLVAYSTGIWQVLGNYKKVGSFGNSEE